MFLTFSQHVSHIFLGSKQILLQRIKIYKQHKKHKSKSQDERDRERSVHGCDTPVDEAGRFEGGGSIQEWVTHWVGQLVRGFVARSYWWMRWVDRWVGSWCDLAGGRGGWVHGTISPVDEVRLTDAWISVGVSGGSV